MYVSDFTDLLKTVPVEILLNFGNYIRTLQLGFWKFLPGIVFLDYQVRTIGLIFLQAYSIWPKPRAFNPAQKPIGTPKFYCDLALNLFSTFPQIILQSNKASFNISNKTWHKAMIEYWHQRFASIKSKDKERI